MNIKQARYIQTIAQEGSITAAAKALYISQPSLSQMLRQVEEELGVALFNRSVSPFQITYAGEVYLQAAATILAANEHMENQLRDIKAENGGRLRLGISVQRAMQVLPVVLPQFVLRYPKVEIELFEEGSARLEELIVKGQVDLAIAAIESTSPNLAYELIEKEVIGIIAGKGSHLADTFPSGVPIDLGDTRWDSYVSLRQGHSVRVVQDKLFRQNGLKPHILLETDTLEVAKRVALEAGACMLCSNIYADEMVRQKGGFYPLRDFENHRHFYACYRKGERLPRYATDFIHMVTDALNDSH